MRSSNRILMVAAGLVSAALSVPCVAADPAGATTAPDATAAAAPVEEKKICRGAIETGSLIKKRKTCLTKAQWLAVDAQQEREARKMVEDSAGRPSGN